MLLTSVSDDNGFSLYTGRRLFTHAAESRTYVSPEVQLISTSSKTTGCYRKIGEATPKLTRRRESTRVTAMTARRSSSSLI